MSDPADYTNHPAVKAGLHTYSQFKKRAQSMKKLAGGGTPLAVCQEALARKLGFANFFQAQSFYRKHRPEDYQGALKGAPKCPTTD